MAFATYAFVVHSQIGWMEFNELGNILVLSSMTLLNPEELKPLLNLTEEQIEAKEFAPLPESVTILNQFKKDYRKELFFRCEETKEIKGAKYFYFIFFENEAKSEIIFNSVGVWGFRNEKSELKWLGDVKMASPMTRVGFEIRKIMRPFV